MRREQRRMLLGRGSTARRPKSPIHGFLARNGLVSLLPALTGEGVRRRIGMALVVSCPGSGCGLLARWLTCIGMVLVDSGPGGGYGLLARGLTRIGIVPGGPGPGSGCGLLARGLTRIGMVLVDSGPGGSCGWLARGPTALLWRANDRRQHGILPRLGGCRQHSIVFRLGGRRQLIVLTLSLRSRLLNVHLSLGCSPGLTVADLGLWRGRLLKVLPGLKCSRSPIVTLLRIWRRGRQRLEPRYMARLGARLARRHSWHSA